MTITPEQLAASGTESGQQKALFAWAAQLAKYNPAMKLHMLHAIPNGGKRDPLTAARLKAEGARAGVPDVCFPVPWHDFAGLYIELKIEGGRVSPEQRTWLADLRSVGYAVAVAWSFEAAKQAILDYMAGTLGDDLREYRK